MSIAASIARGRSCAVLAVALAVACSCARKRDEGRSGKLALSLQVVAAAPTDALSGRPAASASALPRERLPAWTRERPRFFDRDGHRFASAVGSALIANRALARTAAEDRARADLLRLIEGGSSGDVLSGTIEGARITDAFTSQRRGRVFIRVEVDAAQER